MAPVRCLWISRNHDPLMTPTTINLYRISPRSHTRMVPRVRTTCDTPEKTFRTRTSFHLVLDPHLRPGGQRRRKPAPSGSLDTLCTPMWRTLYQKMVIKTSSNFRQRIVNEEDLRHHLWRDPRFIPTTSRLHHRHNVRRHTSDPHPSYPDHLVSLLCA